jgi:hypothetical protein
MPKKSKKQKPELPAPEEFASRHGIGIETARAILGSFDDAAAQQSDGEESDKGH